MKLLEHALKPELIFSFSSKTTLHDFEEITRYNNLPGTWSFIETTSLPYSCEPFILTEKIGSGVFLQVNLQCFESWTQEHVRLKLN